MTNNDRRHRLKSEPDRKEAPCIQNTPLSQNGTSCPGIFLERFTTLKKQKKYRKSRKSIRIRKAFLQSTVIVCSLLLFILAGLLIQILWTENQSTSADIERTGKSVSSKTKPVSKKSGGTGSRSHRSGSSVSGQTDSDPSVSGQTGSNSSVSGQTDPGSSGSDHTNSGSSGSGQIHSGQTDSGQDDSEPDTDTTLLFAGDVYFSDYVLENYRQSGIQGVLSKNLLQEMKQADITMVNNEFPYSTRGSMAPDKQFTFRIDPEYVSILSECGVDLVTLANNHVLDYGKEALTDTFQTLDDAGIAYAGAGQSLKRAAKLIRKKANGHTFGFLAASRVFPDVSWNVENAQPGVLSAYDPARLLAAVQNARSKCDVLCVYVHWGIERNTTPEPYQVSMAHALIDAGADAVIGAHPHVLQGVELYKGKPVFYSLGNFIFYQNTDRTAVAKLTLHPDGKTVWQLLPAKASLACTSLVTDADSCREFYEYMSGLSENVAFTADGRIRTEGTVSK